MTSSTLASRIKERRKALGITQTSLAESVGMRQQSIQYLESGVPLVPVSFLNWQKF
jgi:transcriptional regulator with XRE-family HTH domain